MYEILHERTMLYKQTKTYQTFFSSENVKLQSLLFIFVGNRKNLIDGYIFAEC